MKSDSIPRSGTKRTAATTGAPAAVRFEPSLKSLLTILALVAGVWMLIRLIPVLLVLVGALMAVGALNPLVAWCEGRKMKRIMAICLVFGVSVTLVLALAFFTLPTLLEQAKGIADSEPRIRETVAGFLDRSTLSASLADELRNVRYADLIKSATPTLLTLTTRLVEILIYGVAAVFLAFYMMLDRDRLRGALFAVVPRRHHLRLSAILLNLANIVGGYIRGQVLTCLLMSGFILVLLLACGVPHALAIAVFGGVMDLLPYIGIFLTMGPAVLAAWMQGPAIGVVVFACLLGYEELENRVLIPLVYGRALRLPSSVVFFSLLVGTTLAGIAGALLALPIAAAVVMLIEELRLELPGERMQPEDIAQRRKDDRTEQEYERRAESLPAEQAAAVAVEISVDRKKSEVAAEKAEADAAPPANAKGGR